VSSIVDPWKLLCQVAGLLDSIRIRDMRVYHCLIQLGRDAFVLLFNEKRELSESL
jgi:hypothetical protein